MTTLQKRCKTMLAELGIPVTVFCRKINLSTCAYYGWQKDELRLSDATLARIDNYLSKYGF